MNHFGSTVIFNKEVDDMSGPNDGNIGTDILDEIASIGSEFVDAIADLFNPFSTSSDSDDRSGGCHCDDD